MSNSPLTLAALATSAVPDLQVEGVRAHSAGGEGEYSSAVLSTPDGELIIRVPQSSTAEVRQSAELLALAAIAEGARSELPFEIPVAKGLTRAGDSRAVVTTFLPGNHISRQTLESDALLLQPIAEAIAAVHALPASLVQQAGLPVLTSEELRVQASRLVSRAAQTRLLPEVVLARWSELVDTRSLWDFAPTVIHGSFDVSQLLVSDERITGVLGWSELSVGDPAYDLAWLLDSGQEVLDSALARYSTIRGVGGMRELRARAGVYQQLAVAKWLLHGIEQHDQGVIDDAVAMLDRLVDRLSRGSSVLDSPVGLSEDEVKQLLEEVPEVAADPRSETAEFESLDEDRAFSIDRDFAAEPQGEQQPEPQGDQQAQQPGDVASHEHPTEPIDPADLPESVGRIVEQPTEPIDPADLPEPAKRSQD